MAGTVVAAAGAAAGLAEILKVLKDTGITGGIFGWLGGHGDKKRNAAVVLRFGKRSALRASAVFRAFSQGSEISQDAALLIADELEDFAADADKAADAILGDDGT